MGRVSKADQLKRAGVSPRQAEQWEKLAGIPDEQFEADLKSHRPTTNGIIRANTEPKVTPVSDEALWLWGRLKDFEHDGLLKQEPAEVLKTMTNRMKDEVHIRAPRVAAWLKRIGEIETTLATGVPAPFSKNAIDTIAEPAQPPRQTSPADLWPDYPDLPPGQVRAPKPATH
jgi:hypothetical protein